LFIAHCSLLNAPSPAWKGWSGQKKNTRIIDLPFSLGINPRTFERSLYAKHEDHFEMNVNHMYAPAKFFDCRIEDLLNYEAKEIVLKGTSKREKIELAERLGLIK
jgi:hypothetical protein